MLAYFVRSGYASPYDSHLLRVGYEGDYWSDRARSSSNAYILNFYSSYVHPSIDRTRYYGHSVRFVAGWE